MSTVIATEKLWGQRPGEDAFEITLWIGTPHQDELHPDEWSCPLGVEPLYSRLAEARGGSAFHALCLASSLALDLLHGFKEKGGSLFWSPGENFPFEAYAFGVAAHARREQP